MKFNFKSVVLVCMTGSVITAAMGYDIIKTIKAV